MKFSKAEWRAQSQSLFYACVEGILKRPNTRNTVLFIIRTTAPDKAQNVSNCTVPTYKYEQKYEFYLQNRENSITTDIYICQSEMSNKHDGTYIELSSDTPFADLDYDSFKAYCNSVVSFLMANLVWK